MFLLFFVINNMSITCGYHRYFSHRSYEVHPIVAWLYMFFGSGAFQGSVIQWASDHRRHHRLVDTDGDPYNIQRGFWFAHFTWMFFKDPHPEARAIPRDLAEKSYLNIQDRYYALIATFSGFFFPALVAWALGLGFWGGLLIPGLFRIVATQHSTFLINSYAHVFGKQPYSDTHSAKDSLILAFLTFGEGYHNFHHSFQADYRNGTRWYHWDPSKWCIRMLALIGLAKKLKETKKEEILRARLAMETKFLLAKGASAEQVKNLCHRLEESQKRLRELQLHYRQRRRELAARGAHWHQQRRIEIRQAKSDFRLACRQWDSLRRTTLKSLRNHPVAV